MSVKDKDIIFFDGVCTLCNASVQFIIKRDPPAHYQFCSLQSEKAAELLGDRLPLDPLPNSIVLLRKNLLYTESSAALRICRHLNRLWPFLCICLVIPPFIRNSIYRWIARNRYQWFGQLEHCPIPDATQQHRFLEQEY